jgi:D-serine deaminase-like pyridoxal phosphate-dependent protein
MNTIQIIVVIQKDIRDILITISSTGSEHLDRRGEWKKERMWMELEENRKCVANR